jgi:histidine kinase 2/3/4 (cytokinin receptor)
MTGAARSVRGGEAGGAAPVKMEGKSAVAAGLEFLGMGLDRLLPLPLPLPEKLSARALRSHVYSNYLGSCWAGQRLWRPLLLLWLVGFTCLAFNLFYNGSSEALEKRRDSLASMCDERARMLQDQFNVSMNHLQALAILVSTFHHAQNPSAINQVGTS